MLNIQNNLVQNNFSNTQESSNLLQKEPASLASVNTSKEQNSSGKAVKKPITQLGEFLELLDRTPNMGNFNNTYPLSQNYFPGITRH